VTLALQPRDQAIIRAAWSLGLATRETLRALAAPTASAAAFRERLGELKNARYLDLIHVPGNTGHLWLYGATRRGLTPGAPRPWRPGPTQYAHTLAVGDTLRALTRGGFALPALITGWQGEAELRAWALPGAPYPDARVTWRNDGRLGAWLVEVDRATESRNAWRRKLVRYLATRSGDHLLILTTSRQRAANLAALSADVGVPALVTRLADVQVVTDPIVLHTCRREKTSLTRALTDVA
jgi:hypothetical protein